MFYMLWQRDNNYYCSRLSRLSLCVLCLIIWYFVPFLSLRYSPVLFLLCSPLCLLLSFLACLSPSVCQYCFLHAFSSVAFPHYLTCPPPSSLPTCFPFPPQCVRVLKGIFKRKFNPWSNTQSKTPPQYTAVYGCDQNHSLLPK